jgi:hypothetical protein
MEEKAGLFQLVDKKECKPNSSEVIPLPNNEVRLIQKETSNHGKTVTVSDEKYKIVQQPSLSAARESIASEIIRKAMNLDAHKRIVKVEDNNTKE